MFVDRGLEVISRRLHVGVAHQMRCDLREGKRLIGQRLHKCQFVIGPIDAIVIVQATQQTVSLQLQPFPIPPHVHQRGGVGQYR